MDTLESRPTYTVYTVYINLSTLYPPTLFMRSTKRLKGLEGNGTHCIVSGSYGSFKSAQNHKVLVQEKFEFLQETGAQHFCR